MIHTIEGTKTSLRLLANPSTVDERALKQVRNVANLLWAQTVAVISAEVAPGMLLHRQCENATPARVTARPGVCRD